MKNRILIAAISIVMAFGMSACGSAEKEEEMKQESTKADEPAANSKNDEAGNGNIEDAQKLLEKVLGTQDRETGYTYSFGYVDKVEIDGVEYYGFVWSWLVDDHLSRLSELLVPVGGSTVYSAVCDGDTWEISEEITSEAEN